MPYISKNLTEFWKRWHISLSRWLQQYLYIPLGGNRKGKARTYINLMVTMTLGGLWHGASWTFVIWGMLHGVGLCAHKLYVQRISSADGKFKAVLSTLCTYFFVCFCWIFFRAMDFNKAFAYIRGILMWQKGINHMFIWSFVSIIAVILGMMAAIFWAKKHKAIVNGFYPIYNLNTIKGLFICFVVIGLILGLAYLGNNPFIYFQF